MEMFDSDSEGEMSNPEVDSDQVELLEKTKLWQAKCNFVFVELMKMKPKVPVYALLDPTCVLSKEILVVYAGDQDIDVLKGKVKAAKLTSVTFCCQDQIPAMWTSNTLQQRKFDIVVSMLSINRADQPILKVVEESLLMSKGIFITFGSDVPLSLLSDSYWLCNNVICRNLQEDGYSPLLSRLFQQEATFFWIVRKRAVYCNQAGALYWAGLREPAHVQQEKQLIEAVSVSLTVQEIQKGLFSTDTHMQAVHVMEKYGICIFPGLFHDTGDDYNNGDNNTPTSKGLVEASGWAARQDMALAIHTLYDQHRVDLLGRDLLLVPPSSTVSGVDDGAGTGTTGSTGSSSRTQEATTATATSKPMAIVPSDNFHELSMREAFRCDLRNSPCLNTLRQRMLASIIAGDAAGMADPNATATAVDDPIGGRNIHATVGATGTSKVSSSAADDARAVPAPGPAPGPVGEGGEPTRAERIASAVERSVCTSMNTALKSLAEAATLATGAAAAESSSSASSSSSSASSSAVLQPDYRSSLQYHRGILSVLTDLMNPPANRAGDEQGNWGKWNFDGAGPGSLEGPSIGGVGAVVSLPQCTDQTIHADTPHIFEHVHLPPHYVNLFVPHICANGIGSNHSKNNISSVSGGSSVSVGISSGGGGGVGGDTCNSSNIVGRISVSDLKERILLSDNITNGLPSPTSKEQNKERPRADEMEDEYVDEELVLRELLMMNSAHSGDTSINDDNTSAHKDSNENHADCFWQGQTAFVVGSHRMDVTVDCMTNQHFPEHEGGPPSELPVPVDAATTATGDSAAAIHLEQNHYQQQQLPKDPQTVLESRLIRPHLQQGDALLFDCRILHFGIGNWSHLHREHRPQTSTACCSSTCSKDDLGARKNDGSDYLGDKDGREQPIKENGDEEDDFGKDWRVMLYVNYHPNWFQDPKNWNDRIRLFA